MNSYNIIGLFSKIHRQKKEEFDEDHGWKRTLNILNASIADFPIFYEPQSYELDIFEQKINEGVDFSEHDRLKDVYDGMSIDDSRFQIRRDSVKALRKKERTVIDDRLKEIIISSFPNLKYRKDAIKSDTIYNYSRWIVDPSIVDSLRGIRFIPAFNYCPDYISVLDFYYKRILPYLGQSPFSNYEKFIQFVKDQAAKEREYLTEL